MTLIRTEPYPVYMRVNRSGHITYWKRVQVRDDEFVWRQIR